MRLWIGMAASIFVVSAALAQEYAEIGKTQQGAVSGQPSQIKRLSDTYFGGDYAEFEKEVESLLQPDTNVKTSFDFDAKWYLVVFKGTPQNSKDPVLVMTLAHRGLTHPTTTLPGKEILYEVALDELPGGTFGRLYTVKEDENPLHADLVSLAKLNFAGVLANFRSVKPPQEDAILNPVYYTLTEIHLPFRRSTIDVKGVLTNPSITGNALRKQVTEASANFLLRQGRISECARDLDALLVSAVKDVVNESDEKFEHRDDLKKKLDQARADTLKSDACKDELKDTVGDRSERNAAVTSVLDRYDELSEEPDPKRIEGETTLKNVPRTRYSLGAIGGALFATHGERAKLDGGKAVADPLGNSITLAAFNISTEPFDPTTVNATHAEKFRSFIAYVVTPEPGLAVGGSRLLFRGLSVNVGYAAMLIHRAGKDTNGNGATTLTRGLAHGAFVGFGYNF